MKTVDFPQLALMREGVDFKFEIGIRRFKVEVRPLTNLEIIKATGAAAEDYEKLPENKRHSITMSLLLAMHQLTLAASPDVGEETKLPLSLLEHMNNEEVNALWKQYVRVVDRVNPSFEEIPTSEVEKIVDDLKKNSEPKSLLTDLSISKLIAVCCHLLKIPPASHPGS